MSVKELGRSEAEVMDQLARLASLRRDQILAGGAWPVAAYVAAAVSLMLTAKTVIAEASADVMVEQMIRGFDGRWYVRHGSYVAPCLAGPAEVKKELPVRKRDRFLVSVWRRLFG